MFYYEVINDDLSHWILFSYKHKSHENNKNFYECNLLIYECISN